MIREPQQLLRGACERRVASAVMQARRIHVAASRCRRDRVAMRAPPVRRREPCCVCACAAAAAEEEVRLEWKTACYYVACVPLPCQSDAFRSRTPSSILPSTRMERQHAARHEGIKREWSFACARFAVGCGIEVCFSRNAPLFFYDKIAAEAALTVF